MTERQYKIQDIETEKISRETPLTISRVHRRSDGGVDVFLALSAEQTYVLLEYALMSLTANGFVKILEVEQREQDKTPQSAEGQGPQEEATTVTIGKQIH
jgi:hypothetical protein